jgi:hypothetical protein
MTTMSATPAAETGLAATETPLAVHRERLDVNRRMTLRFLDYLHLVARVEARRRGGAVEVEAERLLAAVPDGWREGSIGWNLLHVVVYEEGCAGRPAEWERFRHGAAPGSATAPLPEIVRRLAAARGRLLARLDAWAADGLGKLAVETAQPDHTRRQVIDAAVWHEPHHLSLCNEALRRLWVEDDR